MTLVELLVVAALIVVISGAVAPSFLGSLRRSKLHTGARQVHAQLRFARELAIRKQSPTRLVLEPDEGLSEVLLLRLRDDEGETLSEPEWVTPPDKLAQVRRLPDGVMFDRLIAQDPQGDPQITFLPDGRGEDWFLSIVDVDDNQIGIEVKGVTGIATLLSPDDPDDYERLQQASLEAAEL